MLAKRRLTLFGTRHHTLKKIPPEVRLALDAIIEKCHPERVLEEWSITQTDPSAADEIAKMRHVPWHSIGTPPDAKYSTHDHTWALDFPDSANISRYGPIEVQQTREELMCINIKREMDSVGSAVVVLGIAHLHSMFWKLHQEFEVEAFVFAWESF